MTTLKRKVQIALPATGDEEWQAVREPLLSGWLTQGPNVAAFEKAFAYRHGIKHALATTSCTTALHLAMSALGIGPGDEVIVPSFTWIATANAVVYCGATPVLCDVDRRTNNIALDSALEKVTERTRAVIPVHLFGLCVDVERLRNAMPKSIKIVEDAACAAGAEYNGATAGAHGDVACFSFHPRKSITTGEGGMLTTNDAELAAHADILRNHGASVPEEVRHHGPQPYILADFDEVGFNYRMTDLQAAIGRVQLQKLDRFIAEREKWARFYGEALAELDWLVQPAVPENGQHAWQAYVTYVDPARAPLTRNEIMSRLHAMGVATRPGTHAVHMSGYYRERYGYGSDDLPAARDCERNTMAIPLHNRMSEDDYGYVVDCIRKIARNA